MKKILWLIVICLVVFVLSLFFLPHSNQDDLADSQEDTGCPAVDEPVCGLDNQTYNNDCLASRAKVAIAYQGPCREKEILFQNLNTTNGLFCIVSPDQEFVINNQNEYSLLVDYASDHQDCQDFSLPEINFLEKTLLGKYITATGCQADFARTIIKDEPAQTYTYQITILAEGDCDTAISSMNWITVPKIPQNYKVEFKVK